MPHAAISPALDPSFAPVRAGVAGALASFAYLGVMYLDMTLTH